jgi:hypothetical protein
MGRSRGPGAGFFPNRDNEPERIPQTQPVPVGDNEDYRNWLEESSFTTDFDVADDIEDPTELYQLAKEQGQAAPAPEASKVTRPQYGTPTPQ